VKADRFARLLKLRSLREQMGEAALVKARKALTCEEQRARELLEQADMIAEEASTTGETNVSDFEMVRLLAARAFDGVRAAEAEVKKAATWVEDRKRNLATLARETDQMEELDGAARHAASLEAARLERKLMDELSTRRSSNRS
jgi:flagellar export protein FliJ